AKATRAGRAASRPSSGATTSGRAGSASQRDRSGVDLSLPDLSDVDDDAFIENLSSGSGKPIPRYGWQGLVYRLTRLNFGPSKRDREELELRYRLNRQLRRTRGYCGYIGIASEKGGVGKT